jgi:hypothetical protein
MSMFYRRAWLVAFLAVSGALMTGCGQIRETLPGRSAMEQLLISTAADRAIADMGSGGLRGKAVYLDFTNLDTYDRPYVTQRVRSHVLSSGASVVDTRDEADIVLEAASGGLSVNKRDYLLGLPAIVIPTPVGEIGSPELPIFKALFYRGKAKMLFTAVDPTTNAEVFQVPMCYGNSHQSHWWFLFMGPFTSSDLPEELD